MLKWMALLISILVSAFILFSLAQGQSLRRASLVGGKSQLLAAHVDFNKSGHITNRSTSGYQVWLSSNVVTVGSTQYQCFAEVGGGWGYDGGRLAMTTNRIFIWLDPQRPPRIITNGYRPSLFPSRF